MLYGMFASLAEPSHQSLGVTIVLTFVALAVIGAMLWILRIVVKVGNALAMFALGVLAACVVFGWVLPDGAMGNVVTTITSVTTKPYEVGKSAHSDGGPTTFGIVVNIFGLAALNASVFGGVALLLTRERRVGILAALLGALIAGGIFVFGLIT